MRDTLITTAIVVRHAERNTDWQGADPPLSPAGRERAEALAQALRDAHVDRIYVTHFLRNHATAEPLARLTGDSIEVVDQGNAAALAARIWSRDRGRTVLIVGHSDTVPAIVRALGGSMPDLENGEFGAMIVVTRRGDEPPHTLRLRYGAP
ncbi:MAG TPA: histidine phosphatase family protein [Candidatus Udaeobacter sp.]|jgi:broad specificity phosphatase PhoE|nr:histidine phosphatase family protein [Candidatus Udaeobacter sp.]